MRISFSPKDYSFTFSIIYIYFDQSCITFVSVNGVRGRTSKAKPIALTYQFHVCLAPLTQALSTVQALSGLI